MSHRGLTLEAAYALIKHTVFEPLVVAPILWGLDRYPGLNRAWLSKTMPNAPTNWVKPTLWVLLGVGVLRRINKLLSQASLNSYTRDSYDWRREIVVVTGGSGGIGDVLVRKLAKHSINVISLDVMPPKTPLPSNAFFYEVDITSSASIEKVAQKIRSDHGDPTVLVNNAGIATLRTILEESEDQIHRVFEVNLIAHFLLVKEFLPAMIKRNHGHIITIASMSSYVTVAQNVDYCCTKAGALAFHEGLAQELRYRYNARKVRTSIIHPASIRTPIIDVLHRDGAFKSLLLEPETVADAIFDQILSGNSSHVILPGRYAFATALRGFPSWLQEWIRNSQKKMIRKTAI